MYDLKANQKNYSQDISKINTDSLAESLISEMTFEEKIDQMYGEKMIFSIFPIWIGILVHKFMLISISFFGAYLLFTRVFKSSKTLARR